MASSNNRFALSFLSRSNKAQAVTGEVMMDKETGQLLVKTMSGDVMSFDSIARYRARINDVTVLAQTNGMRGLLTQVDFENLELPGVVSENTNFLLSPLTVKVNLLKRFLVSVDIDVIETATGNIGQEPTIYIDIRYTQGATTVNKSISGPASQINTMAINPATHFPPGTDLSGYTVAITNIYFRKNTNYTTQTLRNIMHSVLVVVE